MPTTGLTDADMNLKGAAGREKDKDKAQMRYQQLDKQGDARLASIIRQNLKAVGLDLPGTAYFDEHLDHLSAYYLADPQKRCYVTAQQDGVVVGGVGIAECDFFPDCAELQKLYLADEVKGAGIGYTLIALIEEKAKALGYRQIYLETHTVLSAAIHMYERCGYQKITRPQAAVHAAMDCFYFKSLEEKEE